MRRLYAALLGGVSLVGLTAAQLPDITIPIGQPLQETFNNLIRNINANFLQIVLAATIDALNYGQTYPYTLYVRSGGSDANSNACLAQASPCATVQHAVDIYMKMNNKNQINVISVGAGSFAGFACSGAAPLQGGKGISGNHIKVVGAGSANTTLTSQVVVTNGCDLQMQQVKLSLNNSYGVFVQSGGSYFTIGTPGDFWCDSVGVSYCIHAEGLGMVEISSNVTMKLSGTFQVPFTINSGAFMEFDPNNNNTVIDTGSGITVCASCGMFFLQQAGTVFIGSGTSWTGTGASSDMFAVIELGSGMENQGGAIPSAGNSLRLDQSSWFYPLSAVGNSSLDAGCGGAGKAAALNSSLLVGELTLGAAPGATCAITFTPILNPVPWCDAWNNTDGTHLICSVSGGTLTITDVGSSFTAADHLRWRATPFMLAQ